MLRYVLGDSLFFHALKTYISDTTLRYSCAFTDQFIAIVNESTDQNLQWFFDQWVYGRNHPQYVNTYQVDSLKPGEWKVTAILRQIQNNAGIFKMPVELLIRFSDGTDSLIRVNNEVSEQVVGYHFNKKPVELVFDPDNQIILKQALTIYHIDSKLAAAENPLEQNFPNPFSNSTVLKYHVSTESPVRISIIDQFGRERDVVVNHRHTPGTYSLEYSNLSLETGFYQIIMEVDSKKYSRKIVVQH
jgi:hypothetical protein